MYCSDCLQQKRLNENLLLARISRGWEPPHPYLCDVNSSFDLFIKPGLKFGRPYCLQVLDSTTPFSKRKLTILKRQMERITLRSTRQLKRWTLESSWRRNHALFDSFRTTLHKGKVIDKHDVMRILAKFTEKLRRKSRRKKVIEQSVMGSFYVFVER